MTKRQFTINIFLTSFVGYFIGSIAYSLLGGDSNLMRFLYGIISASLIGIIYYAYSRQKHINLLKEMKTEEKDERGQFIRGKASYYTLLFIMSLVLAIFVFTLIKDYKIISMILAISYVLTLAFHMVVTSHLSNKI